MPGTTIQKTKQSSHVRDLALLFAIPTAIAVIAAVAVYVPRALANPQYDFIYSYCHDYFCKDSYSVNESGRVVREAVSDPLNKEHSASLQYYDAANDATKSVTLAEAQKYQLYTSSKSPDGYTLSREHTSSGFLFWGDSDNGWYLKNGAKKKKVELGDNSYYSRDAKFLGWVTK